ncbi:alpha/beta fold hydrolase [Herbiconiux liangxiaofengii]|uniref:alpha/beta fold hydrolase n=1 Tax=Herbiconiux liangxiaofengii TaxID=3342795 RepID=UPI0035B708A8
MTDLHHTALGAGHAGLALAHGAGGTVSAHYGSILPALAAERRVVGVDYPGSGGSLPATGELTLDLLADAVVEAAVAEGLETFPVVGFSLGGAVAVRAAVRHPDRVTALVLTASFDRPDSYMQFAADVSGGIGASGDGELLSKLLLMLSLRPSTIGAMSIEALRSMAESEAQSPEPGAPAQFELFGRADVSADLARVTVPTLVIGTTEDRIIPIGVQRRLAEGIAGARLIELESGHLVPVERPEEWSRLILDFLREVER